MFLTIKTAIVDLIEVVKNRPITHHSHIRNKIFLKEKPKTLTLGDTLYSRWSGKREEKVRLCRRGVLVQSFRVRIDAQKSASGSLK